MKLFQLNAFTPTTSDQSSRTLTVDKAQRNAHESALRLKVMDLAVEERNGAAVYR